jgi:hypothetical protein
MLIMELARTTNSLINLQSSPSRPAPRFCFEVNGPTKGYGDQGAKLKIPCAGITKTRLSPGQWAERFIGVWRASGIMCGFLFSKHRGRRSCLSNFKEEFLELIEEVQGRRPDLTETSLNVREEHGIWRSLRRGITLHAINQRVPKTLANQINWWRNEQEGIACGRDMSNVYAMLDVLIPTLLRYYLAL